MSTRWWRWVAIPGRIGWAALTGRTAAIERAIEAAGIGALRGRKLHTLSDGENQKVMLARALAQDTPLLLLDEPTAHLDLPSRIRLMRLLHRLARELHKGILLSTHELDLALQVADEVWLLETGGSLHKGTPEDLILDGTFEAVFAKEDVAFDRATGVFRIPPEGGRRIGLAGEGSASGELAADVGLAGGDLSGDVGWRVGTCLARSRLVAMWLLSGTRRALQREGFTVTDSGAAFLSHRLTAGTVWMFDGRRFTTISALLAAINSSR